MPSEPQLPDIPLDDLPGGQPVDPRAFHVLHQYIKDALDEGRAVFLNDLQCDLLITYARHSVRQHIPMLPTLAAGAYHAFRTRGVAPENETLYQKLGHRDEIVRLEERFRSKLATSFNGSAPPSPREVPAEQRGKNYIAAMQVSLRQGNYDYAVDMAELGLGVAGGPSPEILASAAICFHVRAAKGVRELQSKLEDIDRAIDLFREFLIRTKGVHIYEGTRLQVEQRLKVAVDQRLEILKRVKRK